MTTATDTFTLRSPDGAATFVRRWLPAGTARGLITIAHGLSEHGGRYDRFARALAAQGFAVYASDHRGHGETAGGRLGHGGPDGWAQTLADLHRVLERAKAEHPGVPAFFIGHSMGSVLGQHFIARHGAELAGAVLIGVVTSFTERTDLLEMVRGALAPGNADEPSAVFAGLFAELNAPFDPAPTGYEWLSRDESEVRKYVDDPMAGNPLTNATIADFFPGWMEAGSVKTAALVPHDLPILIVAGSQDSAGANGTAPSDLGRTYRDLGVKDVCVILYDGARHEVLNETNRADVERDIVAWLDDHVEPRLEPPR